MHYLQQGLVHASSISKSEAESLAQIAMLALLMMSGIRGMGMVMACYGKAFMRQLDETRSSWPSPRISKRASDPVNLSQRGELNLRGGGLKIDLINDLKSFRLPSTLSFPS